MKRALDVVPAALAVGSEAPSCWRRWPSGSRSPGSPIYRQRRVGQGRRAVRDATSCARWSSAPSTMGAGLAVNEGDPRITRWARSCAGPRSTSCRTWSTCCAARCRSSARAHDPGAGRAVHGAPARPAGGQARHHRLGADQRAGVAAVVGAHRARRLVRRPPVAGARPEDPRCVRPDARHGATASTRGRPADGKPDTDRRPPHRRGQALRHRQRVRRARLRVAADPESARAGAVRGATFAWRRPRIDDPEYVPFLQELVEEHDVKAVRAADRPRHRGLLARGADLPAFVPAPMSAARRTTSTRPTSCCSSHGLPSPPTVLPGERAESYPVMVKPRRGRERARSTPRPTASRDGVLRRYVEEPVMVQRLMGGPGVLDRPALRPRRPLPERDPADDDRVARRRVDQGHR